MDRSKGPLSSLGVKNKFSEIHM